MNLENGESLKTLGFFDEVSEFVTIKDDKYDSRKYSLKVLSIDTIDYLKNIIISLELEDEIYLCARGDSKGDEQSDFIDFDLKDFFIVGDKAKAHIKLPDNPFQHTKDKTTLDDIKNILSKCNEILRQKSMNSENEIYGKFTDQFIKYLEEKSLEVQESWKFALLALLHNKGKTDGSKGKIDDYFKPYSCFVSLTYGENKYNTAKKFAVGRNNNGLIYIYILEKSLKNHFRAMDLTNKLCDLGIKWYEDVNSEIMVINGLYPHNIIGFFEINREEVKRFVLNPWFYKQIMHDLKNGGDYNYKDGVLINQENFIQSAKNLGYENYFIRDNLLMNEYLVTPNEKKDQPVIEMKQLN